MPSSIPASRSTICERAADHPRRRAGLGAPSAGPDLLASRAASSQLRARWCAELAGSRLGAAVAGVDALVALRDRHRVKAPAALGRALARHRRLRPRHRFAAARRRPLHHHGRHHRGEHRSHLRRLSRPDRLGQAWLDRGDHHALLRFHLRLSGRAVRHHARRGRGARHGDLDRRHRHLPGPDADPADARLGQPDLGARIRAGRARGRQGQVSHHHRARVAQHPFDPDRAGDDPVCARDPCRGRLVLSRSRHAAAAAVLGTDAERRADAAVPVADARGLSGCRDCDRGARPQSARRRVARSARSTTGTGAMTMGERSTMPLIEVENLGVRLNTSRGPAQAVRGVSFALKRGETLGLVGESGCGKSVTALSLMGLLPDSAVVTGSIKLDGGELAGLSDADYCQLRGNRISMIFQEPMTALNPMHTIGHQVAEPLRRHKKYSASQARRETIALLDRVGLPDPARRVDAYPHQFSGGQRQRVTIAMALACQPDVLIADEPTTALDVTIQGQILDLIADLVAERGMSMILISHDLGVIAENVQRMMVMYGGTVVENGATEALFAGLGHPYSQGLFRARPRLGAPKGTRLQTIAGSVPGLTDLPAGCAFADRCDIVEPRCWTIFPPPVTVNAGHTVRCLRTDVSMATRPGAVTA